MKIVAQDKTNDETVTAAKAALEAREKTEAALQSRAEATGTRLAELTTAAGDASAAIYIGEASGASEAELEQLRETAAAKISELDKAKAEHAALQHALTVAASQTADARICVVRIQRRSHANRIGRLLEKTLAETVRLENSIETSVSSWKTICSQLETLKASWPGDLPTLELLNPAGALYDALELEIWRVGAVVDDYLGVAPMRGPNRFPGARCSDMALLNVNNRKQMKSLSDHVAEARTHLLDILEGRKESRSGQLTQAGIQAQLKDKPVAEAAATSA